MTSEPLYLCQPPDPNPRKPRLTCPPGATDSHVHVYGPDELYPVSPRRMFDVPEALPATLADAYDVMGIDRVVFVQPSGYGFDNSCQLDAMAKIGRQARAVVVVAGDVPDVELERLDEAGARGVRYAIGHTSAASLDDMPRMSARVAELGWHVQFHIFTEGGDTPLLEYEDMLANSTAPIVLDHLGSLEPGLSLDDPGFAVMQRLVDRGKCWIKLSGAYRVSAEPPYPDMVPYVERLTQIRPDRLVWGSDWPHVFFKGKMPNTTDLLDQLLDWLPDEALRNRVLVDNPAELYGFGA